MERVSGFTLIEIAISLFVLSIGVIGMCGLLLHSARVARDSGRYSFTVALAAELADRLRRQEAGMSVANQADNPPGFEFGFDTSVVVAPSADCHVAACSASQLAAYEHHDWLTRLVALLPQARVKVCRDSQPWSASALRYAWTCTAAASDALVPLVIKIGWREYPTKSDSTDAPQVVMAVERAN